MSKIEFKVSAKAARLIGRENISDSTGALLELVKNGYDADADCVFVKLDLRFPRIQNVLELDDFSFLSTEDQAVIMKYYDLVENHYERVAFDDFSSEEISNVLFKYNRIILVDNGIGMGEETIKGPWMHIGTSNKKYDYISEKGRMKTGAKGIGRFALDKLSVESKVITKCEKENTIIWSINWDQFIDAKLLNEISADLETDSSSFEDNVKNLLGDDFNRVASYNWNHGTIIILSPTRDEWTEKHFAKFNNAIASLNPFGYVDEFSVYVDNTYNTDYNYNPSTLTLKQCDYDYKVVSQFDGEQNLSIYIERNELDTTVELFKHAYGSEEKDLNMDDFWSRTAFENDTYSRENYSKIKTITHNLSEELSREDFITLKNLGPFDFEFYFSKLQNNSDYPSIIKRIPTRKRNSIFKTFSGIRIYRDNFKVRPYGEIGDSEYDWLKMGERSQKSPAPIAHRTGKWRVLPYQTLGSVKISRTDNPFLEDVANREGLVLNAQYELLVKLCQLVLDDFEYDRQYYYREISKWVKDNEPKSPEETIHNVINDSDKSDSSSESDESGEGSKKYKEAIKYLASKYDDKENLTKILLSFCASGIFTNTFAHEIEHIQTDLETRYDQIELCLDEIFKEKPYTGLEFLNPYLALDGNREVDQMLASWVAVLMDGFDSTTNFENVDNLSDRINNIINSWKPLLHNKHISINNVEDSDFEDSIPTIDLYTVFNNFILNSIWYLEHSEMNQEKEIIISLEIDDEIKLTLFNNGQKLDDRYSDYPNKIFEAGESSKIINSVTEEKGTGIGLWISRTVLEQNDYYPTVMEIDNGFGIVINKKLER